MRGHGENAAIDFQKEMAKHINEFKKISYKATQEALAKAGAELVNIMKSNTPPTKGTGQFQNSWDIVIYPNAVYVYNTRGVKGKNKGIPIANLAEYASRGPEPFIRNTFKANEAKLFETFKREFNSKIKKI